MFSCVITLYAVPSMIKLAYQKRLFDDPALEERKIHKYRTPNLGGIAVMTSFAFTACLCISGNMLPYANYIFASGLLIFLVGLKDDLAALNPYKKFLAQSITALIVVYFADIRLTSFYGVFGIQDIHPVVSYLFSCLLIVFIINAYNLIDGINGLLGSLSLIVCLTFSYLFFRMEEHGLALLSVSMAGAILGFLRYNAGRARIFMGDAGAYSIGFMISILTIQLIELNKVQDLTPGNFYVDSVPAVAIAILFVPIFDTLRVVVIRLVQGKSPFIADRNHLHHRLLDTGMSHTQATLVLAGFNLLIIGFGLVFQHIGTVELLLVIGLVALLMNTMLWLYDVRQTIVHPLVDEADEFDNENIYQLRDHAREVAEEALQQYEEKQHQN